MYYIERGDRDTAETQKRYWQKVKGVQTRQGDEKICNIQRDGKGDIGKMGRKHSLCSRHDS